MNAVTMGPAEIAGSIPMREKKSGEKTPKKVPAKHPPMSGIAASADKAPWIIPLRFIRLLPFVV